MKLRALIFVFLAASTVTALYTGDDLPLLDIVTHSIPMFPQQCQTPGVDELRCFYRPDYHAVGGIDFAADAAHNTAEFFHVVGDYIAEIFVFIADWAVYLAIVIGFIAVLVAYPTALIATAAPWWVTMLTVVPLGIYFVISLWSAVLGKGADS